jgi:type VI secretion system secreted protein Hcp
VVGEDRGFGNRARLRAPESEADATMGHEDANTIVQEAHRRRRLRGAVTLVLPTAAALGAGAAIAVGAIPGGGGTITGCYLTNNVNAPSLRLGQLRVVDPSLSPTLPGGGPNPAAVCLSDESAISWSQSGPQGPAGATGGQGPAGAPGADGTAALLPAVQFGFDNGAGNMFLKLDGVQGETKHDTHSGYIEISSFSFGAGNRSTGAAGGAGAGKTSFSSFTITKPVDKTSPLLQAGDLAGAHYKEADVFFARKAGRGQQDYLELKIDDVLISSYKLGGASGDSGRPVETIVLDGSKGEATFLSGNSKANVFLKLEGA